VGRPSNRQSHRRTLRQYSTRLGPNICFSDSVAAAHSLLRTDHCSALMRAAGNPSTEIVVTTVGMEHNRTTRFFSHRLRRCSSVMLVDDTSNLIALTPLSAATNSRECSDDHSSPYRLASRTADDGAKGNDGSARGNRRARSRGIRALAHER
jgi:hypothetical protein